MELFDKKFVRFMWDDELEGKEVFVADNINSLIERVEKGASIYKVRWSRDNGMPFESDDLVRYRFAYYDPNYEAKRAFNEGKEIQFKDDVSGDWCSAYNPRWDLNIEYRIKPKNNCVAYLARLSDDDYYLTACYENRWESVQKGYGAKTKLFVGSEGEVREWYESREKFKDLIKAWEDGKEIQVKAFTGLWYPASNPDWDVDAEYRVKVEDEKWIVYFDRLHDYLTACLEDRWESVQKKYHAKTKLFVGTESEVEEWYKSRQKFAEVIKAWEDGKTIQYYNKYESRWELSATPTWDADNYRVKPEGDKMTPTWSNIEDCKHCVYEPKATTQEPCDKCFGKSMFKSKKEKLRPYINSAEMIADFIARFKVDCPSYCEPSIWVKEKESDSRHLVTSFVPNSDDGSYVVLFDYTCDLDELFDDYIYLDGSPCGMEVK